MKMVASATHLLFESVDCLPQVVSKTRKQKGHVVIEQTQLTIKAPLCHHRGDTPPDASA